MVVGRIRTPRSAAYISQLKLVEKFRKQYTGWRNELNTPEGDRDSISGGDKIYENALLKAKPRAAIRNLSYSDPEMPPENISDRHHELAIAYRALREGWLKLVEIRKQDMINNKLDKLLSIFNSSVNS